jgi:(2R)-3-sulfolactate dehydrogenase (NADP+)
MAHIDSAYAQELATDALRQAGAAAEAAQITAAALVAAEEQGLASHGLSRVPQYVAHLRVGRVNGQAVPRVVKESGATVLVDAGEGFAFPAIRFAVSRALRKAVVEGVAFAGVTNSHHFGVAAHHLEAVAQAGLVGLAVGNSPAAIPAWGGKRALFGTNPVAAVFPRRNAPPLVIDLSLSEVARGKLMVAAREGREIPQGWALDREGQPTTDPKAGLEGMMCAAGGVKGTMLALVVELLCVALTGAAFGFEADSFFIDEGNPPRIGQAFLLIDPGALAGRKVYFERIEALLELMVQDEDVRLPGTRRLALQEKARHAGFDVPDALLADLRRLAGVTA